jgi:phosphoadenosine phosphosulfate reductase
MDDIQKKRYLVHSKLRSFKRKVKKSQEIIKESTKYGKVAVSVSWGKDSVALADLVIKTIGPVPIMHMASSYRLPGFEHVEDYFRAITDVHIVDPEETVDEVIVRLMKSGLCYEHNQHKRQAAANPKKRKGVSWSKKNGIDVQMLGLRAEESIGRRENVRAHGVIYSKKSGTIISMPIIYWDVSDVWAYLISNDVPWHTLYDKETHGYTRDTLRNTGWLTTVDALEGRIVWLRYHYPDLYEKLATAFPRVRRLT